MKFQLIKARFLPIFLLIAGCTAAGDGSTVEMQSAGRQPALVTQKDAKVAAQASSPLNATYLLDGIPVVLQNGRAEQDIMPGAAVKRKTSAIGVPVAGDLDRDGSPDAVLLLIHETGGSGIFYYLVAALNRNGRYTGTNGLLLGDRIEPLSVVVRDGVVTVRWKQHSAGQPMSASPDDEKTLSLAIDQKNPALLIEVED